MVVDSKTVGSYLKNNKVLVIGVVIALALSFYGGMRYQSYRIQKAMTSAFGELGKAFGEGFTQKAVETKPQENPLNTKVTAELLEKTFIPDEYFSKLSFKVKLTNKSDKLMKGVQGKIRFMDVFDEEISAIGLSYDAGIPVGESKVWEGAINYSEHSKDDVKLKESDIATLKYVWDTDTIVYEDGSKETN